MTITYDEVEVSKENLQPLPQGRRESSLAGCGTAPMAPHASRHPQVQQFERELVDADRTADPLEVWLRYIAWTEDEFSSGGDRSHITVLLERCCKKFADDPRYKDSRKYLKVWIKFADHCTAGVEDLFEFLRSKSIGQTLALFYQAWAWVLESKRNFQAAEDVLAEGINRGAKPAAKLMSALDAFRARRAAAADCVEASSGTSRAALLQLQKKEAASSYRTGTHPRPLPMSSKPSENAAHIDVFHDENGDASRKTIDPSKVVSEFNETVMNKENISQPTNWVEPLRRPPLAPTYQNRSAAPPIKVFVDPSLEQTEAQRHSSGTNLRNRLHGAPVSERLRSDPLQRIQQAPPAQNQPREPEPAVDYERSYNADMLHDESSPDGFCFEEIRARCYMEKRLTEAQDDMPMTVNYSQILSLKGPGLATPAHLPLQTPLPPPNPRRLQFMMTPAANVIDVPSIETFLTSNKSSLSSSASSAPLLVARNAVPPPSPTVTMTVETRKALQEVRCMFVDGSSEEPAADHGVELNDKYEPTTDFEIYQDPTVDLRAQSKASVQEEPVSIVALYDGPTTDPLTPIEHLRIIGDLSKQTKNRCIIDHSSVPAPDEIRDIAGDQTIEVDDADLLVSGQLGQRVFEAQDICNDSSLVLKIVRPADPWEAVLSQRLRERIPEKTDSLVLASRAYVFEDLALVVGDLRAYVGSLQTLIEKHQNRGSVCPEPVALLYTQQLLTILHLLYNANVAHCQIHPRHLILSAECHIISLIDFSSAVDLKEYSEETRFASECIAYPPNWRFEVDYYGAASTIHQLLFGNDIDFSQGYANALQNVENSLPKTYAVEIWMSVFQSLLTDPQLSTQLHDKIETHWQHIGTDRLKYCLCDTNILMNE